MPLRPAPLQAIATTIALRDVATAGGPATPWIRTIDAVATNDGGGGLWRWEATSTAADNTGTVVQPDDVPSGVAGRWHRDTDGQLDIIWFGAVGDNTTDCSAALQAAFNAARIVSGGTQDICRIHVPIGRFVFKQTIDLPSTIHLTGVAPELSVLRASSMSSGADGLRAHFEKANGTAMHVSNLQIADQAGTGGALLSIKGGGRMQIRNLSFNYSGNGDGSAGLRLIDCQDCEFSNLVMTQIGRPDQVPRLGAALSIYHEGFADPDYAGVRPNNLYFHGLRIEDPRATGLYVEDGRGIQLFSGKIDGSFGSVVPEGVPAIHLKNTTNLRWRDSFVAGMKGPNLHIDGYSSAEIIDPIWAPGQGKAMITGTAAFGAPSALNYLAGHIIVPGVTITGGSLNQQMPTYSAGTVDAFCDVTVAEPVRYDDLTVTSRAYNSSANYTAVYCGVPGSFPSSNNVAQGLFLVDKTSGRRWQIQDDFAGTPRQFRLWGNVAAEVTVGAAMQVEWDVFPGFRLALRDSNILRPREARNAAEVPRLFTEVASGLSLSGPAFDGTACLTEVATGVTMTADEHAGHFLIDSTTRDAWYIAGNNSAGVLALWYDITAELSAAITAGHRFDITTGIDRTVSLIGDRALWQYAAGLRQGTFPITDWKTGGTPVT